MTDRASARLGLALVFLAVVGDVCFFTVIALRHRHTSDGLTAAGAALAFLALLGWLAREVSRPLPAEKRSVAGDDHTPPAT